MAAGFPSTPHYHPTSLGVLRPLDVLRRMCGTGNPGLALPCVCNLASPLPVTLPAGSAVAETTHVSLAGTYVRQMLAQTYAVWPAFGLRHGYQYLGEPRPYSTVSRRTQPVKYCSRDATTNFSPRAAAYGWSFQCSRIVSFEAEGRGDGDTAVRVCDVNPWQGALRGTANGTP